MMTRLSFAAGLAAAVVAMANAAIVTNGGFEQFTGTFGSDGGVSLSAGNTDLTGWDVVAQVALLQQPNDYGLTASAGANFLDLTGYNLPGVGLGHGIEQLVGGLVAGATYRFAMDLGISIAECVDGEALCGGPIKVLASIGSFSQAFTHDSALDGNVWATYGFDFTADGPSALLSISFAFATGVYVGLDNVSIDAVDTGGRPLPEPPLAILLATALFAVRVAARKHAALPSPAPEHAV